MSRRRHPIRVTSLDDARRELVDSAYECPSSEPSDPPIFVGWRPFWFALTINL